MAKLDIPIDDKKGKKKKIAPKGPPEPPAVAEGTISKIKGGLNFSAPEFIYYEKGRSWFLGIGILTLVVIGIAVLIKSWFLIGVMVLAMIVFYQYAKANPRDVSCSISDQGVKIGERFYPYQVLKSFWVVVDLPQSTLYLESTHRFSPFILVHIYNEDLPKIRETLLKFLPEKQTSQEEIFAKINRFLRF
jgi:hypothetical protein